MRLEENIIPDFFADLLNNQYGKEKTEEIINGFILPRYSSFRANLLKSSVEEIEKALTESNIPYEKVSWFSHAFIIDSAYEPDVRNLSVYENGGIYMQSLSSMLPPLVLEPHDGERILDMASAPGGKTTEIASLTLNKALITACEKNKIRAERLAFNIKRQGATRTSVLVEDAAKLSPYMTFDKILLDAPCSGSGTICVKDGKLVHMFNEKTLSECIKTQTSLIKKASELVKVGGTVVYSTCSILESENERILDKVLADGKMQLEKIDVSRFPSLPLLPVNKDGAMCVCPNDYFEGFFISKLKRIK